MILVTALDARDWNTGILGLVYLCLLLFVPSQIVIDQWGNRRDRKKRNQAKPDTPSTTTGS